MKIISINAIFLICEYCIFGLTKSASIESDQVNNLEYASNSYYSPIEQKLESEQILKNKNDDSKEKFVSTFSSSGIKTDELPRQYEIPESANLAQKLVAALRKKQIYSVDSNKQVFGGRLPPIIERIIQRIQNYFSVYNPPEYFESNRPPITSNEGITIICSNAENESVSCGEINETSNEGDTSENCDPENQVVESATNTDTVTTQESSEDAGYNVVVTHTVVHDNMINVYSPSSDPAAGNQIVSNVVVILEPSAAEYTPQHETPNPASSQHKFYVYVNPTAAQKKKNTIKIESESEKPESFQPYSNATYTVIIRGDKLEEYSSNIENVDNSALNPEIVAYIKNSTNSTTTKPECSSNFNEFSSASNPKTVDCPQKINNEREQPDESILASKTVVNPKTNKKNTSISDVPNINLVLSSFSQGKTNKTCSKHKVENNSNDDLLILKPDSGSTVKIKNTNKNDKNTSAKKTPINTIAATYLPPIVQYYNETEEDESSTASVTEFYTFKPIVTDTTTNKLHSFFNIFKKRPEEPRQY